MLGQGCFWPGKWQHRTTAQRLGDRRYSDRPAKHDKSIAATGGQEGRNPCESQCDEYHTCFGIQKATQRNKRRLIGIQYWAAMRRIGDAVREISGCSSLDNSVLSLPANDQCIRGCVLLQKTSGAFCGKMRGFTNSCKTRNRCVGTCGELWGIVKLRL